MSGIGFPGFEVEDDPLAGVPGTTLALTAEGWEAADYVEPADDWRLEEDGSISSPDGTLRTWLLSSDTGWRG